MRITAMCVVLQVLAVLALAAHTTLSSKYYITDPRFQFGDEPTHVGIYRLVGNDMPPLQTRGQLRWNSVYALDNEPVFPGARVRWILNRIWNETEFELIYKELIGGGVHRRDILARCFDEEDYASEKAVENKLLYLTSQNEARNEGIIDGRNSGFEWSVVLDGNTFLTMDSWEAMQEALKQASDDKKLYLKIPYHRVHSEQKTTWLNTSTTMQTVIKYAPMKGESQMAFHKSAKEIFSLGDTKPENKDKAKPKKGYGQRNKSYMFKEGEICAPESKVCACADVMEGNEEDVEKNSASKIKQYTQNCGLVLRLWSYPTENVVFTGLSESDEEGFFCYMSKQRDSVDHKSECDLMRKVLVTWDDMKDSERKPFKAKSDECKAEYSTIFLKESCIRAADREIAQSQTVSNIEALLKSKEPRSGLCQKLRPPPNDKRRKHYLTSFDEPTLAAEKKAWESKDTKAYDEIKPLIQNMIAKADRSLKLGPYSVTTKKYTPQGTKDKRYYFSMRPYWWPIEMCPSDLQKKVGDLRDGDVGGLTVRDGYVHRDGMRVPGTVIGGEGENNFDRSSAWYIVDNVTTLALAGYFTGSSKYSKYAAELVVDYFLDDKTGMYPSLDHAQDGDRTGCIDWKDFYYLLDAFTLLEMAEALSPAEVAKLQIWTARVARWFMTSKMGHEEGSSLNNHGLYFDLSMASLAVYSQADDLVDITRSRLHYRLVTPYPKGHFAIDGSQPHELIRPTSLHYITFNLIGWIHVALVVEAVRANSELPGSMESLFWVRHENEAQDAQPVLLKAIKWLTQFLPVNQKPYKAWTAPQVGMNVKYPYHQEDDYAFDRMLEIMHYGCKIYGSSRVFPDKTTPGAKAVLSYPLYSTDYATMTTYSSVHPDSGTRSWPALGIYGKKEMF